MDLQSSWPDNMACYLFIYCNIKSIVHFNQIFKVLLLDHPLAVDFDFGFIYAVPTTKVWNGKWGIEKQVILLMTWCHWLIITVLYECHYVWWALYCDLRIWLSIASFGIVNDWDTLKGFHIDFQMKFGPHNPILLPSCLDSVLLILWLMA